MTKSSPFDDLYSDSDAAKRRDEVVRRMANTPPQPHVSRPSKIPKEKAAPGQSSPKPGARKD